MQQASTVSSNTPFVKGRGFLQEEETNLNAVKQSQQSCSMEDLPEKYRTKNAYGY